MERLREAGFVICGKTNTPELGILATTEPEAPRPPGNSWDTERSPGSHGCAVAAEWCVHGSDGGGSIRQPSACTGG